MWDYVPTNFFFCRQRGRTVGVRFHRDGGDRVDPSPHDHQSSTCMNNTSEVMDGLPVDTWMHRERPIFIGRANQVEDRRSNPTIGVLHVDSPRHAMIRLDGWNDSWKSFDRGAIELRSWLIWRDRGTRSRHDLWPTIVVQSWPPIGTQSRIKRPAIFRQKSSLKTDVLPLIL